MQILVVHSDPKVLENIETLVSKAGCIATITANVSDAKEFLGLAKVDAFILEDHLPDGEGAEIPNAQQTSYSPEEFPTVFLHGNTNSWPTQISTYSGPKAPFNQNNLLVALSNSSTAIPPVPLSCGPLTIELNGDVYLDSNSVKFSQREKRLLISLALHQGQPMSSTRILSDLWGQQHDPNTNIVAVYIKNIRKKLHPYELIKTLRGIGYLMDYQD